MSGVKQLAWPVKTVEGAWSTLDCMKTLFTVLEVVSMLAITALLIGGLVHAEPKVIISSTIMALTLGSLISFNHLKTDRL